MAKVQGIWDKRFPQWARPAIEALKKLDASDAAKGKPRYDGRFLGIDLEEVAELYVQKYSAHQPGVARLFEAAAGLHQFAPGASKDKTILNNALFAGARALLLSRPVFYDTIPGFKNRFIDVEFKAYFNQIREGKTSVPREGWSGFWKFILSGCRADLFKTSDACPFK